MKKNILLLIIFSSFLLPMCAQNNDVTIIKEISKSIPKDLYILDYAIGNFISEKDLSIIVFCDKTANKDAAKSVQKACKKLTYMKLIKTNPSYGENSKLIAAIIITKKI